MIGSVFRSWVVVVSSLLLAPLAASASSIFFDLDRIDDFVFPLDEFALFVEIEIDSPATTVVVTTTTLTIPMELGEGIWENANDHTFTTLADLKTAVNGTWTIVVTGGADASTSTFTFNANTLGDADFPPTATGLFPADGATGVSATALLSWAPVPTTAFQFVLNVFAGNDVGEQEVLNLLGEILSFLSFWQPPLALPNGPVEWGVLYAGDPTPFAGLVSTIGVTDGLITWEPHPLIGVAGITWPADKPLILLASETIVQITVPEPAEMLQSGVALAMLGLLAGLRSRKKRSLADVAIA